MFQNVDQLCARVDHLQLPALIDLSWVDFFEPFAVVYLGMFLRHCTPRGRCGGSSKGSAVCSRWWSCCPMGRRSTWARSARVPPHADRDPAGGHPGGDQAERAISNGTLAFLCSVVR
jgi:hypothetical protein